jgi:hypothetical protein
MIFGKKNFMEYKMGALIFLQVLSETFLIVGITERDMIKKMRIDLHVKCQLFLSEINKTWLFSIDFRKILQYEISLKPVWWELSHSI